MNHQELHKARLSHRFKRGILGVLYGIFVLVLLINSLLQTSMIQNFLAHKASELLSKELGVEVNIEKIHLSLMMDITMQGVTMKDFHHNEMVKADYLYVAIEGIDIRKLKFSLTQLRLENSGFVLRKYENEEHYNISMVFPSDTTDTTAFIFPAYITCGHAQLKNCFFQLINDQKNIKEDGFDYNHIDLKIETLKADKILISDDEYSFKVKQLQVRDTSGFCVEEMTTWMKFLPDGWYMDQFQLKTPSSHLDMDLKLAYSTFDNIGEFIDSVRIISEIRPSVLDVQDIAYFTESLKKYSVTAGLAGKVDGWVNDLQIEELKINVAENTAIDVSAYLRGIMNPESAFMNIKLDHLATTLTDLQSMESIFGAINIPKGVMDEMELSGSFKGTLNDFDATAIGKATCGAVNTHVKMWKDPYFDDYQYYGFFVASDLHTTSEMGWEDEYKVQEVFLNFEGFGTSLENVKMELNGEIDRINAFGYEYDTLLVKGVLSKKMFQGNIDLNDKNIGLNFSGMVTLDTESPVFDFSASIKNGYLARLGLLPSRADDAHLSLDMSMKLKGEDLDHLLGLVELNDVVWVENDSVYNFNDLKIGTYEQMSGNRKIVLRSPMMDANVEGDFLLTELDQVMDYFSSIYIPSYESLMQEDTITDIYDGYDLEWDLSLKDITPLTRLLIPELKIPYG
ncbi:MAG: hypothetical protein PHR53_08675, partial [Bacteroidales bacterium]|nr:hypothetical protein [Bacteroidales bacterium]